MCIYMPMQEILTLVIMTIVLKCIVSNNRIFDANIGDTTVLKCIVSNNRIFCCYTITRVELYI